MVLVAALSACAGPSYVVNSAGDEPDNNINDGKCQTANNECTLRAAIMEANISDNVTKITFENVSTISPTSSLPALTASNTHIHGESVVTLDGGSIGGCSGSGLEIKGSRYNIIQGLTINNFGIGIYINGLIGVARYNIIGLNTNGPPDTSERNVISGNCLHGIYVSGQDASDNTVSGNYIGTSTDGNTANPNGSNGITIISGAHDNLIGSTSGGGTPFIDLSELVAHWKMDEVSGKRFDAYGSNDLSDNNTVGSGAGKISNTADFESNDSEYLSVADNADFDVGDNDFSFTGWFQIESTGAWKNILNKTGGVYEYQLAVHPTYNDLRWLVWGPTETSKVVEATTGPLSIGTWYFFYVYHDSVNNEIGVSINAGPITTSVHSVGVNAGNDDFRVGKNGAGRYHDGLIDELSFWKAVLTETELDWLYNSGSGRVFSSAVHGGNVISGNGSTGISMSTAASNHITGNYIGTTKNGLNPLGNNGAGIRIGGGSTNNHIGIAPTGSGSPNVISANNYAGVLVTESHSNIIAGNYIGIDSSGTGALGNAYGVWIRNGASGNVIGTNGDGAADAAEGNVISGNVEVGIRVDGSGTSNNAIAGNHIGMDSSGTVALGNIGNGIYLSGSGTNNRIGTNGDGVSDLLEANVISSNVAAGISITSDHNRIAGNFIGTDATGVLSLGNGFTGILIYASGNNNLIGTNGDGVADAVERNIISANGFGNAFYAGISISGNNNVIAGNYIGTDATGTSGNGNAEYGIMMVDGASGNLVGTDGDGIGDAAEGNVISGNGERGIWFWNASSNQVSGNLIGTNAAGTAAIANGHATVELFGAIEIESASSGNVIGTNSDGFGDAAERNVISGNAHRGIKISGQGTDNNIVAGNYIGTDVSGSAALGNAQIGVEISDGASFNRIGTDGDGNADAAERNVISANGYGVFIIVGSNNQIAGNYIGTDAAGTSPLGNAADGVHISASNIGNTSNNWVGGTLQKANVIAFNQENGVRVFGGNVFPDKTLILYNSIHSNGDLGIDLQPGDLYYRISPNDPGDVDSGANDLMNFPEMDTALAIANTIAIGGQIVDGLANTTFLIQFFENVVCDTPGNHGEGQIFLGETTETTNGSGNVSFLTNLAKIVTPGQFITATATYAGKTSEFSECVEITSGQQMSQDLEDGPDFFVVPLVNLNCRAFCTPESEVIDFLFEGVQYVPVGWDPINLHFAFSGEGLAGLCFAPPQSLDTELLSLNLTGEQINMEQLTSDIVPIWSCPDYTPPEEDTDEDDDDRAVPTGTPTPAPPQCDDGIDNDGDGFTDYAPPSATGASSGDPQCRDANDNDEANP